MGPIKVKEYEMLRKESMDYLAEKESIRRFAITSTIAILTLSGNELWAKDVFLFIIPMIVIILSMIKTMGMEHRTKDIIGYRIVFLENDEEGFSWAKAVTKYDKRRKTNTIVSFFNMYDYVVLSMLCLGIYLSRFKTEIFQSEFCFNIERGAGMTILGLFLIVFYLSFRRTKINSAEEFDRIIDQWKEIKESNLDY